MRKLISVEVVPHQIRVDNNYFNIFYTVETTTETNFLGLTFKTKSSKTIRLEHYLEGVGLKYRWNPCIGNFEQAKRIADSFNSIEDIDAWWGRENKKANSWEMKEAQDLVKISRQTYKREL